MATVFSKLKSTRGNPYVYHTLSYTLGERTKTTQVYNFTLKTTKDSGTYLGTGYSYSCYINVNGTGEKSFSYKAKNDIWESGYTSCSTKTFSYTANIDPKKTSSIPLTFRTTCTYAYDGATSDCTTDKKSYTVSANAYTFNSKMKINGEWKDGQFYINVDGVWKEATPYTNVEGTWKKCE